MNIYVVDILPLQSRERFYGLLSFVPPERRDKIERCRYRDDACLSLAAGLLLEYGLNRRGLTLLKGGNGTYVKLTYGKCGKPALAGQEGIYFNLSHSGRYAAVIFADTQAGIDIEQIKEARIKVARRFFMQEETEALLREEPQRQDVLFAELWSRKESCIKAVGAGMSLPLDSFSVLGEQAVFRDKEPAGAPLFLKTWKDLPPGYCLSVCAGRPCDGEPQLLKAEQFFRVKTFEFAGGI